METLDQYTWILVLSVIAGFVFSFGLGANDMANSFATSVGSKAITIFQAVIIAGLFEFLGAVLLGSSVTSTIKSGIAKTAAFSGSPELLMFGFFCVMVAGATWDLTATYYGFPVSTTHTVIGAIIGMSVSIYGFDAVVWSKHQAAFPYIQGFVPVVLAWVVSPILAGICVLILYGLLRTFVLRAKRSFDIATIVLPFLVGLTFFVVTTFIIQVGTKNKTWDNPVSDGKAIWIGFVVAGALGALSLIPIFFLRKRILADEARASEIAVTQGAATEDEVKVEKAKAYADLEAANNSGFTDKLAAKVDSVKSTRIGSWICKTTIFRKLAYGSTYQVHDAVNEEHKDYNKHAAAVWSAAEVHDVKTEQLFRYLQVFSASAMAFAHGANDVANTMGPFAAVYQIWRTSRVPRNTPVPVWILVIGGIGLTVGLATYGYKILRVLGVEVAKLSNTRGFCCELSAAIVVLVASRYGLPVSTTQIATGALISVGLFEGLGGVNWRQIIKIFIGWILTIVCAALLSAALTSFLLYSPNKQAANIPDGRFYG
jgi:sodium-dependent phosphate transporter